MGRQREDKAGADSKKQANEFFLYEAITSKWDAAILAPGSH